MTVIRQLLGPPRTLGASRLLSDDDDADAWSLFLLFIKKKNVKKTQDKDNALLLYFI